MPCPIHEITIWKYQEGSGLSILLFRLFLFLPKFPDWKGLSRRHGLPSAGVVLCCGFYGDMFVDFWRTKMALYISWARVATQGFKLFPAVPGVPYTQIPCLATGNKLQQLYHFNSMFLNTVINNIWTIQCCKARRYVAVKICKQLCSRL